MMVEVVSNKLNPWVIPHLHVWGNEIALYLFFGGIAAGLLIISSSLLLSQKSQYLYKQSSPNLAESDQQPLFDILKLSTLLAPIVLSIGMIPLFLDLEYKFHVWRFYTAFIYTSPMSWGSWLLMIFYPFSMVQAMILYANEIATFSLIPQWLKKILAFVINVSQAHLKKIIIINIIVGIGVGIYTGILLSTLFARPLWSSSLLGILFLFSGLSAAAALMLLFVQSSQRLFFTRLDSLLISIEIVVLALFIIGGLHNAANIHFAMIFLITGPMAPWFWLLFVCAGLIIPLLLGVLELNNKISYLPIIPIMVLLGSLSLRLIIVSAGQMTGFG